MSRSDRVVKYNIKVKISCDVACVVGIKLGQDLEYAPAYLLIRKYNQKRKEMY